MTEVTAERSETKRGTGRHSNCPQRLGGGGIKKARNEMGWVNSIGYTRDSYYVIIYICI